MDYEMLVEDQLINQLRTQFGYEYVRPERNYNTNDF
jgi:hypothetical protein